jgi:hypothetical protein
MEDKNFRPGIDHQVAELIGRVVPIHGNGISADLPRSHTSLEERDVVAHAERDTIACRDAEAQKSGCRL